MTDTQSAPTDLELPRADPAPSPQEIAARRMTELVSMCIDKPVQELRELRDQIDDLIRSIQQNGETITQDVENLAERATSAIAVKTVVKDAVGNLRLQFKAGPAVLTQQRKSNGK